jgi:hypothetical protein
VVVPVYKETEAAALDAVGESIANTIGLSFRLLGDFEVRTVPRDRIPAEVIAGVRESVEAFAERETMDYVVLGSVRRGCIGNPESGPRQAFGERQVRHENCKPHASHRYAPILPPIPRGRHGKARNPGVTRLVATTSTIPSFSKS